MPLKVGDRVRVIEREVTAEDRKSNRYFSHMAGLTGTIESIYSPDEVSVKVEPESLSAVSSVVHDEATRRMRERFQKDASEEAKAQLEPHELNFPANFVVLARMSDLEAVK